MELDSLVEVARVLAGLYHQLSCRKERLFLLNEILVFIRDNYSRDEEDWLRHVLTCERVDVLEYEVCFASADGMAGFQINEVLRLRKERK